MLAVEVLDIYAVVWFTELLCAFVQRVGLSGVT